MDHSTTLRSGLVIVLLIVFLACSSAPQKPPLPVSVQAAPSIADRSDFTADVNRSIAAAAMLQGSASAVDYQIGAEDLLEITIFNIPEADGKITPRMSVARVSHQGQISLPLIGDVHAKGLTVSTLEQTLRQRYDKYIHSPQIGVLVREFRQRVSVIGAVQKPGVVELTGPKTVIEILAIAGGVNDRSGSQVHLYRQGGKGRETHVIDLAVLANSVGLIDANNAGMINMPVQSGDMINIPEAGMFFVDGAVRKPGSYPLGRRYTLAQALATAGGVDPELNSNAITVFRRHAAGEIQSIELNLSDIGNGGIADLQIQADDVIMVPTNTAKYVVKRFIGQLIGGISLGSFMAGS